MNGVVRKYNALGKDGRTRQPVSSQMCIVHMCHLNVSIFATEMCQQLKRAGDAGSNWSKGQLETAAAHDDKDGKATGGSSGAGRR